MVDKLTEQLDKLNFNDDKSITKTLQQGETILLSTPVYKFNDYKRRQDRNLMITNKAIYNLKENKLKRKIELDKVKGITVGIPGNEFILHVPDEYDYRYASAEMRFPILLTMTKVICDAIKSKIPFFFKEEIDLFNYATTKSDKKKKMSRMPSDPKQMDEDSLKQLIETQIAERENSRKRTNTLFGPKGKEVTVDSFEIIQVLGAGAFGTVLLVKEKETNEWYAMKVIKKDIIIKKGQFEHTKTEKMILEHVNHPYLVTLVYAFQDPTKLYFIMKFMKGGELFQHLRIARKFEEKRAKFYTAQLALGIGHLHQKDIVYRDLKLENILMDEIGNVYVSDFGMAKILKPDEKAMTFCGTPEYLSPEVILGKGCDKSTDWWSLGILTYEMMYGLPPFYNRNQSQMFKLIKDGELKFPEKPAVSKEGQEFIMKCLNRDPNQRLGSQQDVKDILQHSWFKDLNMDLLLQKKITPPFKPKVDDDQWLNNFDNEFTSMNYKNMIKDEKNPTGEKQDDIFKDF